MPAALHECHIVDASEDESIYNIWLQNKTKRLDIRVDKMALFVYKYTASI